MMSQADALEETMRLVSLFCKIMVDRNIFEMLWKIVFRVYDGRIENGGNHKAFRPVFNKTKEDTSGMACKNE